jgi:hypothetical protein
MLTWSTCARSAVLAAMAFVAAWLWPAPGLWLVSKLALVSLLVAGGFVALGELDVAERRLLNEVVLGRLWRR